MSQDINPNKSNNPWGKGSRGTVIKLMEDATTGNKDRVKGSRKVAEKTNRKVAQGVLDAHRTYTSLSEDKKAGADYIKWHDARKKADAPKKESSMEKTLKKGLRSSRKRNLDADD